MISLNFISFVGIFGLCAIAWLFSENRSPKFFPWRVVIVGILLQLLIGALVFIVPGTRELFQGLSSVLNVVFEAADAGARFLFGPSLVPFPGEESFFVLPLNPDASSCPAGTIGPIGQRLCAIPLGYVLAFRVFPAVIFFSGLIALLYNIGVIQAITTLFAKIFYSLMRLSGAESLSGAANIFVGIEAEIAVREYIGRMTRSELCTILACGFGTTASSTLAIYVAFLKPVFPNILGHLVTASIMAIPACFLLSKILVPETQVPLTANGVPRSDELRDAYDSDESFVEMSPLDAAIRGAVDGVRVAVTIAGALILILGLVFLFNQFFAWLATLPSPVGDWFQVITLQNILGALFLPLTALTGVSLNWPELWQSSVLIGRRLFETEIPPYQALGAAVALPEATRVLSDRALLIVSYALTGFASLASVGIFVGGTIALAPNRHRQITSVAWKALFAGTLATYMIACVAGTFDRGDRTVLGVPQAPPSTTPVPAPTAAPPSPGLPPGAAPTAPPVGAPTPQVSPVVPPSPVPTPAASPVAPSPVAPPVEASPSPSV